MIIALVNGGAYLRATNNNGQTPLEVAKLRQKWDAVSALEKTQSSPKTWLDVIKDIAPILLFITAILGVITALIYLWGELHGDSINSAAPTARNKLDEDS